MGQQARWTEKQRQSRLHKLVERNRSGHRAGAFLYEDADWMRMMYLERGLSLRAIADEAQCGLRTVARWMDKHGIERRPALRPLIGDHPTYEAAHFRVAYFRGKATDQQCAFCGKRATDWAYDHTDPAELPRRTDPALGKLHGPYSVDLNRYIPLCKSCHKLFDLKMGKKTR